MPPPLTLVGDFGGKSFLPGLFIIAPPAFACDSAQKLAGIQPPLVLVGDFGVRSLPLTFGLAARTSVRLSFAVRPPPLIGFRVGKSRFLIGFAPRTSVMFSLMDVSPPPFTWVGDFG